MRPVKIDFSGRSPKGRWIGWGVLLLAAVSASLLLQRYFDLQAEFENWNATWHSLQKKEGRREIKQVDGVDQQVLQSELKIANKVLQHLTKPWDSLFQAIENSIGPDVVLLSLEPDMEKGEVRLGAEAKDIAAMLDYQRKLSEMNGLAEVHIVSHQVQMQDPQKPVRFQVNARWSEMSMR